MEKKLLCSVFAFAVTVLVFAMPSAAHAAQAGSSAMEKGGWIGFALCKWDGGTTADCIKKNFDQY